ncbi:MAG: tRNA uridine-5-carboxymethylaminomethyl(34) synthesis GTPase MnmE [Pseudomonadota bacterium]|nr:tRNA uridine-5-carboxymethylaminomethyl(34) synthesis GTPase MnmE [Pseudomonadota bacterium]
MSEDTIFALASGQGRAGVAVFRLSGPHAVAAAEHLSGKALPPARTAALRTLRDPAGGEVLDHALVIFFPGPNSFTGEDVVEFHTHGGRAVTTAVVEVLSRLPGLRLAEPGEFSRRAFENGKMDLTAVEGIADLVDAETAAQRRQALRQMEGELGRLYGQWREKLLRALAWCEAYLDFPDEGLPPEVAEKVWASVADVRQAIQTHLDDDHRGERLRDGFSVAIVGAPNAGKSSLLNALARREAAIVSAQAGTTRDVIEVHLDLGGFPVIMADTAGLRESGDTIEGEGIRRALARAGQADLKLAVFDVAMPLDEATLALVDGNTLPVLNKTDAVQNQLPRTVSGQPAFPVSVQTGEGMATLLKILEKAVAARLEGQGGPPLTRTRHRAALEDCVAALARAGEARLPELAAEDLRLAVRHIGRITGHADVEEVLDIIFRDFCIGK